MNSRVQSFLLAVAVLLPLEVTAQQDSNITSAATETADHVVVLHGLARSSRSMRKLSAHLEDAGFVVHNLDYPSTSHRVEYLTDNFLGPAVSNIETDGDAKIHFVGHSMGGILARYYLSTNRPDQLGHVVTLGTPHQGSELVDSLSILPPFKWINGPAGMQMGTAPDSWVNQLPSADYSLGSIAGTRSYNPVYSAFIDGDNDGKVSVTRAQLPSQADFIELPYSHTFLMNADPVQHQVLTFLKHGRFDHDAE